MTVKVHSHIWVCNECMLLHANGDRYDEPETDPWALWTDAEAGQIAMGGEHDEDCPNQKDSPVRGEQDCYCELQEFSTSSCEGCGSTLYGSRHAFTVFEPAS
jgi:hypothetical protein